jgi:hypothetical protein
MTDQNDVVFKAKDDTDDKDTGTERVNRIERAKAYHDAYNDFITATAQLTILRKVPESTECKELNERIDRAIREVQTEIARTALLVVEHMGNNKDLTRKDFAKVISQPESAVGTDSTSGQYL